MDMEMKSSEQVCWISFRLGIHFFQSSGVFGSVRLMMVRMPTSLRPAWC